MMVSVTYQFHDQETEDLFVDTDLLSVIDDDDGFCEFVSDVRQALVGPQVFTELDGRRYQDSWGNFRDVAVPYSDQAIHRHRRIAVVFDA